MAGGLWDIDPTREPVGGGDEFPGGGSGGFFSPPGPPPPGQFQGSSISFSPFQRPPAGYSPRYRRRMGGPSTSGYQGGGQMPGRFPQMSGGQWNQGRYANAPQAAPQAAPQGGGGNPYADPRYANYYDQVTARLGGGAAQSDYEEIANLILGGQGRGIFGPEGDPRIAAMLEEESQRQGLGMENAALLGADLGGGDFATRGLAATLARSNAQRARADLMGRNKLDRAKSYEDLLRSLFLGKLGGDYTMDDDFTRDRWAANREGAARGGGLGRILGDVAGRAAGAALSGGSSGGASQGRSRDEDFMRYDYMGSGRNY